MDEAGGGVAGGDWDEAGIAEAAFGDAVGTTGMEMATGGRVDGAGDVAVEDLAPLFGAGHGHGYGGQQGFGVGVCGRAEDVGGVADLDDTAEVHDGDVVGDVADNAEVVADEEVGEAESVLQVFE